MRFAVRNQHLNMPKQPIPKSLVYTFWGLTFLVSLSFLLAAIPAYLSVDFDFGRQVDAPQWLLVLTGVLSPLASFGCAAISIGLAGLLFLRKRSDGMALFISFYLLVYAIVMGGPLEVIPGYWGILQNLAIPLQTGLLTVPTVYLFVTFPDGRFRPTWTRWLVAATILIDIGVYLRPAELVYTFADLPAQLLGTALLAVLIASIYAMVYRFRRISGYHQRQQTKWVVGGLILWIVYIAFSTIPWVYIQNLPAGQPLPWWSPLTSFAWWTSLGIFPISLSIAILRARLWDIDLIIRRTLSYAVLTGALALVYFGGVVLLQAVFRGLSGQAGSPLVTVLSTLAIAALFNPLRTRIQEFIDRRFYRAKYDAEQALASFAETAREEVDLESLATAMIGAVGETMQPEHVDLWLKPAQNSTSARRQAAEESA